MQQKSACEWVINLVKLRVINDLNNRRTQVNIQTLKGKQIKNGGTGYV